MPDYLCTELTTISIVKFNIPCYYLSFEKHMQMYFGLREYTILKTVKNTLFSCFFYVLKHVFGSVFCL